MSTLKFLIEKTIQKIKKSDFRFDDNVSSTLILSLVIVKSHKFLRTWRFLGLKKRGRFLFFGRGVKIFNRKNVLFGNNVNIEDYVQISALGKGLLEFGDNVTIGSFSRLIISTSFNNLGEFITIGSNVGMGEFAYIGGGGGTRIGSDTIIGQYFSTHPENHIFSDQNLLIRNQGVSRKGIAIGRNCWIGSKVTILDGVYIGDNCVIAAGSVVTKSFEDNSLIGGVPAKLLKKI